MGARPREGDGMSGADHQHSAAVEEAARWLSEQKPEPHPVIPTLRSRFNLTAVEACEVCAMATRYRINRSAHA